MYLPMYVKHYYLFTTDSASAKTLSSLKINLQFLPFSFYAGPRCRNRHSITRIGCVGGSDRPFLQSMGQNPHAVALPARLQTGAAQGAGDGGLCCRRRGWKHVHAPFRGARMPPGRLI